MLLPFLPCSVIFTIIDLLNLLAVCLHYSRVLAPQDSASTLRCPKYYMQELTSIVVLPSISPLYSREVFICFSSAYEFSVLKRDAHSTTLQE